MGLPAVDRREEALAMIGLGSYAFLWRLSPAVGRPMDLEEAFAATREAGVDLFQICDWAPLEAMTAQQLDLAAGTARELGLRVQLGTRGVAPAHLRRFLDLARVFDARLVRSMVTAAELPVAERLLRASARAFEDAEVVLALETYEQVATADLVGLVESVGSPALGICLDPANTVARLEQPREVVERCAPYVRNVHVKDFAFSRRDGWVGFTLAGAPLGAGLLDLDHLLTAVDPVGRGVDLVVEHWLPWQGGADDTVRLEQEWTTTALDVLKERIP